MIHAVRNHVVTSILLFTLLSAFACVQAVPAVFPPRGEVEFRNVVMAYRPGLPTTLKGVSFTVLTKRSVFEHFYTSKFT